MDLIQKFTSLFLEVWKKGILGIDIFQIIIGIGIFLLFLLFRGLISKLIIKKLEKLIKAQSKKIKALKHSDEKLTEIKFVNVFFDLKKYKKGEEDINDALKNGYEVSRHFQTESGVVVCLGKYKPKNKKLGELE